MLITNTAHTIRRIGFSIFIGAPRGLSVRLEQIIQQESGAERPEIANEQIVMCRFLLLHPACRVDVNVYLFAYVKNERAWVLQSPSHIWNNNVGAGAEILPLRLYR